MSEDYLIGMSLQIEGMLLTLFQDKVGSILYLALQTRPNLMYSVTPLSRRSNKATTRDISAVDRLLRT